VARIGGNSEKPPLCFTGHLDTVPLGAAPWSNDPFAAEIADGRLYGRGSSDMKSGVAAIVIAMLELAPKLQRSPGVVLVITAAEETGSEGAHHLAGLGQVLGQAGAMVVAEPTANYPYVGHKGTLWLQACTRGVTAHGSMPERGVNAIYKAARAIGKLEHFDFKTKPHAVLGAPTLNVGTIHGGMNINSVPDRTEIGIDLRTVPGQNHAALCAELRTYLGDDVELSPTVDVGSLWTDPDDSWVQQVFAIMAPLLGKPLEPRSASYFTDGATLAPAYGRPPTVILGPGEPTLAHQTDEYCVIERIAQAIEANLLITKDWCKL
jgi:succinyl-diaminopimelate desuccinylase